MISKSGQDFFGKFAKNVPNILIYMFKGNIQQAKFNLAQTLLAKAVIL